MKLNRSGFSAKEFLAVIIIICMFIIVMIPTILNMIETSDRKVLMNNVITFRTEIDKTLLSYVNGGDDVVDGCYYVMNDGNVCLGDYDKKTAKCLTEFLKIDLDGVKPSSGAVDITSNKVSDIHNIRIEDLFVNIDKNLDYYISEDPKTQSLCRP